jgi:hypothetical protein
VAALVCGSTQREKRSIKASVCVKQDRASGRQKVVRSVSECKHDRIWAANGKKHPYPAKFPITENAATKKGGLGCSIESLLRQQRCRLIGMGCRRSPAGLEHRCVFIWIKKTVMRNAKDGPFEEVEKNEDSTTAGQAHRNLVAR